MIKASADTKHLPLFEALASEVRLNILKLLAIKPMNNKDIAEQLHLSGAIVTMHIRKLQQAGLVHSEMVRINSGTHKLNSLAATSIEIALPQLEENMRAMHEVSVPIGHYTAFEVHPTCGLATTSQFIGHFDDPRYFLSPERMHAHILWFGKGYIEYKIPNYLLPSQQLTEIEISMELSSEAPGINPNWPSDIRFELNHTSLGYWTSPGDSGSGRGSLTPEWWPDNINQYGFLKVLRINEEGTFIDGLKISDNGIQALVLERNQWTFRIAVDEDAAHVGGLTLFGKDFGNYNQDIVFRTYYTPN
ncbi:transcriptional regulator, ArsR family [Paenibacillus curdlanolyticus YK9]|uniref:Transcriptional regulator, ArsR family n=1 Tax=Paenibacillus curdlanolyticus YK9 TaxID=717606 RepID=E0IFT8_9BACL|nr:ArsR family transcriptional regulator [Paenibacillus curdlanolyticus]EFM08649.1 transcriptional regulator, ArsR family [Paenibacillus curdlanolyticus YK9]